MHDTKGIQERVALYEARLAERRANRGIKIYVEVPPAAYDVAARHVRDAGLPPNADNVRSLLRHWAELGIAGSARTEPPQ